MGKNFTQKDAQKLLDGCKFDAVWVIHVWDKDGNYQPICKTFVFNEQELKSNLEYWNREYVTIVDGPYFKK